MQLFSRNPIKKLERAYAAKLLEARDCQRSGNIQKYSLLMEQAEEAGKQLEAARQEQEG